MYITSHEESISPIMSRMMDAGLRGATVVDCRGMLRTLEQSDVEAPPIFGSLRQFINPERQENKLLMIALRDEEVPTVRDIVRAVAGDLKRPNTGVLFTVPIMNWEGVSHRQND